MTIPWTSAAGRPRPTCAARRHILPRTRDAALAWAELAGLCALAVAEPILEELQQAPEVFAALEVRGFEALLFAMTLAIVPPTLLLAVELAIGAVWSRGQRFAHAGFVAFLVASIAWQLAHRGSYVETDFARLVLVGSFCCVLVAYLRTAWLPSVTRVLGLATPVVVILFLTSPQVGRSFTTEPTEALERHGPPVVLIVFDELPLATLLGADGSIDASLFPNFAQLAEESTWYRNARTVSDQTVHAVPAILTGESPGSDRIATGADYPQNIFTLFGGPVLEGEVITDLCGPPVCGDRYTLGYQLRQLAKVGGSVALTLPFGLLDADRPKFLKEVAAHGYGYPKGFDTFVAELAAAPPQRPILAVFHELLPHTPWRYRPNGQTYSAPDVPGQVAGSWSNQTSLVGAAFKRHVLQTRFVDRQLGRLMRAMKRSSIYDGAALAVASDHGISFVPNTRLRELSPANAGWILPVPLFVKRPGQKRGEIEGQPMRTIDIVPTLARAAGLEAPETIDGRTVGEPRDPKADARYLSVENGFVQIDTAVVNRAFERAVAHRNRMLSPKTRGIEPADL